MPNSKIDSFNVIIKHQVVHTFSKDGQLIDATAFNQVNTVHSIAV